ncbi:GGDEF domain-containing protein [Halomonas salipaludis]|uniref:diguanylate cyclase n=1 Tax=Halomonas salipaludis TaxID=2032625 RepID=A0A2A2ENM0_9GAMM|nr:GGDEF domain-containing protein [Halomonas salipaludis]PAU73957.1 hypothetical protein CK498_25160 [Halomonas salipaludis]
MSPLKTQYRVDWLTGQLCDGSKESLYRESINERVRYETCLALILAASVFGMFAITDYYLLGLTREYYLLVTMCIVVVSLCLILAFVIARWGSYSHRLWLHALPLWILATGIILIVPLRPESLSTQVTAVVLATMAFYLLIPNLLRLERLQRNQFLLLHEECDQNHQLLKEITHRKSLEEQLRMVAERDELTGLNSRSHFMKRAKALLQRSRLEKMPFSVFMIDVDHFKSINDTWGHSHGDWVLTKIAEVCAHSLRPTDVIGRFGGEEFVVALPNTGPDDAQAVAERLKMKVAELPLKEEMSELSLSITIGIAIANTEEVDLEALISRADQALYVGKRDGRNRVVMCHEGQG